MFPNISKLFHRIGITRSAYFNFQNFLRSTSSSSTQLKSSLHYPNTKVGYILVCQGKHDVNDFKIAPILTGHLLNTQDNLIKPSKQILDIPIPLKGVLRLPTNLSISKVDIVIPENVIDAPPSNNIEEKKAARLIVIRRQKMKKHKLKKLRKKMKFEWAKVRQRREMRKEKAFQAKLIAQMKEAEAFDAAEYVAAKLHKAQEKRIPTTWKGRHLPQFIIKQKLGIKDK